MSPSTVLSDQSHSLAAEIAAESTNVPTLDVLVLDILKIANNPDAGIQELMNLISKDVGMAAHVLRIANSAMFGFRGRVADLQRAGMLIGTRGLRAVVLGARLIESTEDAAGPVDTRLLWTRSVVAAVVAREHARSAGTPDADECFTAGLLSNVGKLAMAGVDGFAAAVTAGAGWPNRADEIELCGVSSDEVTSEVLINWQLPTHLADSIRTRHDPLQCSGEAGDFARVARLADDAAAVICQRSPRTSEAMNVLYGSASRCLGLTPDSVDDLVGSATPIVADVAAAFKLQPIDQHIVDTAIERARMALIDESIIAAALEAEDKRRIQELQLENERLEQLSSIDGLTGIANRRTFDGFMAHTFDQASACDRPVPADMLIVDIDRFKNVNDTFGHSTGDEVLAEVARRIGNETRQEDLCARIGGEEFAAVMLNRSPTAGIDVAERIRAVVADSPVETSCGPVSVTVSVGVASCSDMGAVGILDILNQADSAMYRAKQSGRDRVCKWGETHG